MSIVRMMMLFMLRLAGISTRWRSVFLELRADLLKTPSLPSNQRQLVRHAKETIVSVCGLAMNGLGISYARD